MNSEPKTPSEDELVRTYVEHLGPITLDTEYARQQEARRGLAKVKADAYSVGFSDGYSASPDHPDARKLQADALREFADHQEKVLEVHGHALDETEIGAVGGWIDAVRTWSDRIEAGDQP